MRYGDNLFEVGTLLRRAISFTTTGERVHAYARGTRGWELGVEVPSSVCKAIPVGARSTTKGRANVGGYGALLGLMRKCGCAAEI
jgi:hypothetical protein